MKKIFVITFFLFAIFLTDLLFSKNVDAVATFSSAPFCAANIIPAVSTASSGMNQVVNQDDVFSILSFNNANRQLILYLPAVSGVYDGTSTFAHFIVDIHSNLFTSANVQNAFPVGVAGSLPFPPPGNPAYAFSCPGSVGFSILSGGSVVVELLSGQTYRFIINAPLATLGLSINDFFTVGFGLSGIGENGSLVVNNVPAGNFLTIVSMRSFTIDTSASAPLLPLPQPGAGDIVDTITDPEIPDPGNISDANDTISGLLPAGPLDSVVASLINLLHVVFDPGSQVVCFPISIPFPVPVTGGGNWQIPCLSTFSESIFPGLWAVMAFGVNGFVAVRCCIYFVNVYLLLLHNHAEDDIL